MFEGDLIPMSPKTLDVSHGEFVCPHCKVTTPYKHRENVKRRRIFFITFLGETLSEFVECQRCKRRYTLDVLRTGLSPDDMQMLKALQQKLTDGMAIQEAEAQLQASGFEAAMVKRYVGVATGINHKKCVPCGLTYRAEVLKCHKCGHVLPAKNDKTGK